MCVTDDFRGLTKDQLVKILRSEELRIEDEYQVFTAAMDWVLHEVPKRKKHIVEVLEPVRFPLLSPQRLFKYIESKESITTSQGGNPGGVLGEPLLKQELWQEVWWEGVSIIMIIKGYMYIFFYFNYGLF